MARLTDFHRQQTPNNENSNSTERNESQPPSNCPIPLLSGPFYRPITITLYNTCHCFFTLCKASQGYFGNLARPVLTHFIDVHFTLYQSTCLHSWQLHLCSLLTRPEPLLLFPCDPIFARFRDLFVTSPRRILNSFFTTTRQTLRGLFL
jgi:hypothetical protein